MSKIFIDSNVILDFLLDRKPYSNDIAVIMEDCIRNQIAICVSSVTITNLHYIIGRMENKTSADKKTAKILKLVTVENVGQSTVNKSISSSFNDFEDGVQNYCAVEAKHKIIITRNTKDYKNSELAIFTPIEYLNSSV